MNKTVFPFAAILLGAMLGAAQAATREATIAGAGLSVDTPCARRVDIRPDPALHGQVVVSAAADHQEELDRLVFETRDSAHISTGHQDCWRPGLFANFSPTLELTIRVPQGAPIAIDESAAARYSIGPVGGKLAIDLSGAAQIAAEQATSVSIDLSGAGDVAIGRVDGDVHLDLSGHGQVSIAEASVPKLNVELSGAGAVKLAHGDVGSASLDESGFGAITIGAVVGSASVDLSGAGSVHFAKVTGALTKDISGMGSVKVGD